MGTRDDILRAAGELLARHGVAGTSTRAVCEAAGVTAPTLYHHFGDKRRLLDAVVDAGFERYMADKRAAVLEGGDPVENLRRGWDAHVAFGLAHPAYYAVMFAPTEDGQVPRAAMAAMGFLLHLLSDVQAAGRLAVEADLALQIAAGAAHGLTSLRLAWPDAPWHEGASDALREAVIAAVVSPEPVSPRRPDHLQEDQA